MTEFHYLIYMPADMTVLFVWLHNVISGMCFETTGADGE